MIVLATKPQHLEAACSELKPALGPQHLVISIAAGVSIESLLRWTGAARLIRVMPNTPCLVSAGAAAFAASAGATAEDKQFVQTWFSTVGIAAEVPEKLLDAITGLSGSGPAYGFTVIEALADGGVLAGLPRDLALEFAAQTMLGAAKMVLETSEHPAATSRSRGEPRRDHDCGTEGAGRTRDSRCTDERGGGGDGAVERAR